MLFRSKTIAANWQLFNKVGGPINGEIRPASHLNVVWLKNQETTGFLSVRGGDPGFSEGELSTLDKGQPAQARSWEAFEIVISGPPKPSPEVKDPEAEIKELRSALESAHLEIVHLREQVADYKAFFNTFQRLAGKQ